MKRLLAIGECMIELAPARDDTFAMGFAGDTFNTAWYAQRLAGDGLSVGYLSAIGDDQPSGRMADFIRSAGIKPYLSIRKGQSVGLYMISLNNGERSFSYWRNAAAARSLADDLHHLPDLGPGDVAYFSGITMAILPKTGRHRLLSVLASARAEGIQVVFDPNLRPRLWQTEAEMCDWVMRAAAVSTTALPSFEDEQTHFRDADPAATAKRYQDQGVQVSIVKDGPGNVLIVTPDNHQTHTPEPATQVVDTTAAGDSFNAGYLVARLQGQSEPDAVAQGCALARKVIGARGALVKV